MERQERFRRQGRWAAALALMPVLLGWAPTWAQNGPLAARVSGARVFDR